MYDFAQFVFSNKGLRNQFIATALCTVFLFLAVLAPVSPLVTQGFFLASFIAGLWFPLFETAEELAEGKINVDFLMILVAIGAWALGHPSEGAMLLVLFGASRAMEAYARGRTRSSISDLLAELPRKAHLIAGEKLTEVAVDDLLPGQLIRIKPGDRFPVDCLFVEGQTSLDFSAMTGEAKPIIPTDETEVPSGTVNGLGLATAKVLRPAKESAYQKIIALIENAPARRSPSQVMSDRFGSVFTWVILSISLVGFLIWWRVLGLPYQEAGYRSMVLLVAGSPCAIVLSIPSAILAAISSGARKGILFNGGIGLSSLPKVMRFAFDKTGTLSTGEPGVVKTSGDGATDSTDQQLAYALARSSTHPASRSVERFFKKNGLVQDISLEDVREIPGRGITGFYKGERVELGRPRGCDILHEQDDPELSRVTFFRNGVTRIRLYLSENARPEAAQTVRELHNRNLHTIILSGDGTEAVRRMALDVGIAEAHAELSPDDKFQMISTYAEQPGGIAMVGDGVNDAPALARATVGIAMGVRGSAAALAQADVVLLKDRLTDLIEAYELGKRTERIIKQNLTIAIGAASIMICVAVFGKLPLALGVFGHEGGTVLVVLNSLRLLFNEGKRVAPPLIANNTRLAEP